jgi:hypothetical protein
MDTLDVIDPFAGWVWIVQKHDKEDTSRILGVFSSITKARMAVPGNIFWSAPVTLSDGIEYSSTYAQVYYTIWGTKPE